MRESKGILNNIDWITIFLYLLLVFFGWINIYAAIYNEDKSSIFDFSQNYGKQMIWISTSLVLGMLALILDSKFYPAFSYFIYFAILFLLVAVLVAGKEIAGSRSWFQIGGFSLQPSEFAKFAACLALARFLSKRDLDVRKLRTKILAAGIIGLPALLILLQHDTGSALVFSSLILVLFRQGLSGKLLLAGLILAVLFIITLLISKLFVVAGIAVIIGTIMYFQRKFLKKSWFIYAGIFLISSMYVFSVDYAFENILEDHQKKRINVLIGKEKDLHGAGYNVHQSKIAIGSGRITGKGFLKGTQTKYNFVPEQSTDFIFCTIGEEWGFLGSSVLIILFAGLLVRLVILAERQRSAFARIYGYGVASILFFHFAVNIGMTIGFLPVIGIPLPFVSYGGSSLWGFSLLLFIFLKLDSVRLDLL
ncbi:MAG: rod shape-determining protein RodA [Bacteroidales bacterium]|nr:rod shape-determining protein RodA [Bacteroidales bacterium]